MLRRQTRKLTVRRFGETQEESDYDETFEILRSGGTSADCAPNTNPERQVKRRAGLGQDVVGWDLTEDVADEQDRDRNVEVVALHTEIGFKSLDPSGSVVSSVNRGHSRQGVSIEIIENDQDEQSRHQPPINLALALSTLLAHLSQEFLRLPRKLFLRQPMCPS